MLEEPQQGIAAAGRVTDAKPVHGGLVEAAVFQVGAGGFAFQGAGELLDEKRLCFAMHFNQCGALLIFFALFRRALLGARNGNAAFFRHDANGVRKFALLHLHHKTENVAALAAPEAVIDLASGMNVERRSLLRMKRAEPAEILPGLLELDVFAHHADDVRLLLDAIRE